ncbi:hypothetical protein [Nocardia rhizosphaerae]|uniref:WD40 repeat protein n=1 Tax=Nocardia rhizosphaerae TaxID=1691571 RepID=A0ABV8LBQ8_9NOCA
MKLRFTLFVMVIALSGSGISCSSDTASPQSMPAEESTTREDTTMPQPPAHGLIFAQYAQNPQALVIEIVDPSTGNRGTLARFPGATLLGGLHQPGLDSELGFRTLVSPDLTKVLVNRKIDGDLHAGWLDRAGAFTDVTAAVQGPKTDFSGPITGNGYGFDGRGRFYYSHQIGEQTQILAFEAGAVRDGTVVHTVGGTGLIPRPLLTASGDLDFDVADGCSVISAQTWAGERYVFAKGSQLSRSTENSSRAIGSCGGWLDLLPATNRAKVLNPVASPDGSRIAFMYRNTDGNFSLYTVGIDGGTPEKLAVAPGQGTLVGWR